MHPRAAVLACLLLVALPAPLAWAQGAEPAPEPAPMPPQRVWTVFTTVQASILDNYAIVKVIEDIGNRGPDPEFPFQVRVPADAFVSGLTIVRDGQEYNAEVKPREEARAEYNETKEQQQTGGLVEKTRGTQLYAFLINTAQFESVRATLTYETYLAADQGVYTLPLEAPVSGFGQDLGAQFEVSVQHTDGVTDAWGTPKAEAAPWHADPGPDGRGYAEGWRLTYRVGPRGGDGATPFNASYEVNPTSDHGSIASGVHGGQGYFAHRFRAPAGAAELPIDLVMVLDISGSMAGLKMQQMKDAAAQVVNMLGSEDRLHLVFFSSSASSPWRGLRNATAEQRAEAAQEIASELVAGGTNIEDGMRHGFAAFDGVDWAAEEGRMPVLVFLTDGQANAGISTHEGLRQAAREANAHGVHVFALAFGNDADWGLVSGLAEDGNGTALRVPEGQGAEVDLRRFMAALTTPVLRDVRVAYEGEIEAYQTGAPVLFAGSELLVIGTYDPALERIRGVVTGLAPDGPRRYPFDAPAGQGGDGALLARVFAYETIRALQDRIAADGPSKAWVDEITRLALDNGFVTDYTSLVVRLAARPWQGCIEVCRMEDDRMGGAPTAMTGAASSSPPTSPPMGGTGGGASSSVPMAGYDTTATTTGLPTTTSTRATGALPQDTGTRSTANEASQTGNGDARKDATRGAPGFDALLALAGLGVALLVLRRKR